MERKMKLTAALSLAATALFAMIYHLSRKDALLSFAITFGTVAYHFCMRLAVGGIYDKLLCNKVDYTLRFFQLSRGEEKLYRLLKVKKWKNKMPTYDRSVFDPKLHTWYEISQAMCQSELVHETIILLSFLPLFASRYFGAFYVFLVTSFLAAAFDSMFVMMQRYNRARILKLIKNKEEKSIG